MHPATRLHTRGQGVDGVDGDEVKFSWDGKQLAGRPGEPVAVALWRHGILTQTRSQKYHRPRGPQCMAGGCPGCLVRIDGVPNLPGCRTPVSEGLVVESQIGMPTAERDVLGVVDALVGHLDHERDFVRPWPVRAIFETIARNLAGFGQAPTGTTPTRPGERIQADVLVAGGGPAGLAAALAARQAGATVLLAEPDALGGSLLHHPGKLEHPAHGTLPGPQLAELLANEVEAEGVRVLHGPVLGLYEDAIPVADAGPGGMAVHQLEAGATVLATGAHEGPVLVPGNDTPGVLGARAARILLNRWGVPPGKRIVVADPGPQGLAFVEEARAAGLEATVIQGLTAIRGGKRVEHVETSDGQLPADGVVLDAGLTPAIQLAQQAGLELHWARAIGGHVPVHRPDGSTARPDVFVAGSVAGLHDPNGAMLQGHAAGRLAAGAHPEINEEQLLSATRLDPEARRALREVWTG